MSLEVGITLKANPQVIQRSIEEERESFLFVLSEKCEDYGNMWYMVGGGGMPVWILTKGVSEHISDPG